MLRSTLALVAVLLLAPAFAQRPALIVQITVDQLRGDMPDRIADRLVASDPGGFGYFQRRGVVYTNAHYRHASTYTATGHATLFTGGDVAQHGYPGNYWLDRTSGEKIYCVADQRYPVLDGEGGGRGRSPQYLTSSTIGDELISATGGRSRVFSVAVKDRAAIIPGGRSGRAFWFSQRSGGFTSSSYYFETLPAWVKKWNSRNLAAGYKDQAWELLHERDTYTYSDRDRPWERPRGSLGESFPHRTTGEDLRAHYWELRYTPFADELTLAFAKELIINEKLGSSGTMDFLSIGFSATDYIGHAFGPNSLEAEDNLLRLDRTLAELLSFLDGHLGLERVLLVLSSDHGVDAAPEYKKTLGFQVGRIDPVAIERELEKALRKRFSRADQQFIADITIPGVYLRRDAAASVDLLAGELEEIVAQELRKMPGVAHAVTRSRLMNNDLPRTPLHAMVQNAFHPERSGDVFLVQEQSWFLSPAVDEDAATHGSPYSYDTYVPLMFAWAGLAPARIARRVSPEAVAPTLAAVLKIKPPTGSTGEVLEELLSND